MLLATTYVRLVEAALVEYRLGQSKLKGYWSSLEESKVATNVRIKLPLCGLALAEPIVSRSHSGGYKERKQS
jgi:hypothetical protein